jgi:hypothetical protein
MPVTLVWFQLLPWRTVGRDQDILAAAVCRLKPRPGGIDPGETRRRLPDP